VSAEEWDYTEENEDNEGGKGRALEFVFFGSLPSSFAD
jgi:hypothetical protein